MLAIIIIIKLSSDGCTHHAIPRSSRSSISFVVYHFFVYHFFVYHFYDIFVSEQFNDGGQPRGVISTFSWGQNVFYYFSMPPDY